MKPVPAKFKKLIKKHNISKPSKTLKAKVTTIVKKVINKEAETKSGVITFTPNLTIQNNFFRQICTNFLATAQGTADNETIQGARIGDKIKLKGVKLTGMFETNERFSQVYLRILVIKKYRGAVVTNNTHTAATGLFRSTSVDGNAIIDQFDNEKNKVIYQKLIKLTIPPYSISDTSGASFIVGAGIPGTRSAPTTNNVGQAATYRWSIWLSAKKLGYSSGQVQYENNSTLVKNWDYEVWFGGHSGLTNGIFSGGTAYNVGVFNMGYAKMYYKDM